MIIPRISVLLSVWNGEKYIKQAVESILSQSFKDFEFIIIDDGSTDSTSIILDRFDDPRIVRLLNEKNIGLVKSLNKGLDIARGEFIARMDADDISVVDRFEKQIEYLDKNKEVGVLGTAMKQIDIKGTTLSVFEPPQTHSMIIWTMLFNTAIIHASVMMRRNIIFDIGKYNESFIHIEDTELWSRLIFKTRFANLSEVLYIRRLHRASIMSRQSKTQITRGIELRNRLFEELLNKKISYKFVTWFSYPEIYLTKKDKKNLIDILRELCDVIIKKDISIEPEEKRQIERSLDNKITLINNANKYYIIKIFFYVLKELLPVSLKHKIHVSKIGRFIEKAMK